MKTGLRRIASAVLLMSALAVPSYGWGNGGHMAVAYVAYRNLMPPVRDRACRVRRKAGRAALAISSGNEGRIERPRTYTRNVQHC